MSAALSVCLCVNAGQLLVINPLRFVAQLRRYCVLQCTMTIT